MKSFEERARKDEARARKDEQRAHCDACRAEDRAARYLARALAFFRQYPGSETGAARLAQAYDARKHASEVREALFPLCR